MKGIKTNLNSFSDRAKTSSDPIVTVRIFRVIGEALTSMGTNTTNEEIREDERISVGNI